MAAETPEERGAGAVIVSDLKERRTLPTEIQPGPQIGLSCEGPVL